MSGTATEVLRETEIRPDHLMEGQSERFAADIRRLLEHQAHFRPVDCPACGSSRRRKAFEKYQLSYVVCDECQTMYVSPRPRPQDLDRYYATSENYAYWNKYIFPASESVRREKIFRPRAERIADIVERFGVGSNVLLEVGAGFGTFAEEMQRLGLFRRVVAVEPTPDLARTCRERGLEVIEKPFEQVGSEVGQVDLVASFEVLEHLFSPREFVQHCASVLAPGGLLVLTCPNVKGFDISVLQALSDSVDVEHLNYFHPASLSRLVSAHGFSVLEVTTPGKLDAELVRKKALAGLLSLEGQPFLQQVLIDDWDQLGATFQQFLASHGLSSHMWLVARRNESRG